MHTYTRSLGPTPGLSPSPCRHCSRLGISHFIRSPCSFDAFIRDVACFFPWNVACEMHKHVDGAECMPNFVPKLWTCLAFSAAFFMSFKCIWLEYSTELVAAFIIVNLENWSEGIFMSPLYCGSSVYTWKLVPQSTFPQSFHTDSESMGIGEDFSEWRAHENENKMSNKRRTARIEWPAPAMAVQYISRLRVFEVFCVCPPQSIWDCIFYKMNT